ncbi:PiggyBac transposable element-derived protein 4 [Eumeta japonica]|uniref:PiggyBac transposable element-derived protein 4 n=1 Tax=Eumeta variegata TaxID=151549 RepID=A0A4C1X0U3_EUMVA|nr:PiggyBac transposable element-derived protein 4 [Eumeta japonica]
MTSRRRFRLDSDRGIRDIFDILQNDDDSDIEEDTERNETEEAVDDFRAGHEQLDLNDEDIPERGQLPIRTRGWPRSRGADRSRVRSTVRSRSTRSRGRGGRTVHNARQIDEANGWSYKPIEHLPENPVFQDLCTVMPSIDEYSTEFDCFSIFFPDSFWKLLKEEINRYASQMKAKQARQGVLKLGSMLYNWKPVTMREMKKFLAIIIHMTLVDKESFDSYWSTREIIQTPFSKKIMTRSRFRAIYSCLHLNDNSKYIPRARKAMTLFLNCGHILRSYRICVRGPFPLMKN